MDYHGTGALQRISSTPSISCYILEIETEIKKSQRTERPGGWGGGLEEIGGGLCNRSNFFQLGSGRRLITTPLGDSIK